MTDERQGTTLTTSSAADIRISVLGPLVVTAGARTVHVAGVVRRRLLGFLATQPGRMVSLDAIVDALWDDDPPPSAAKSVLSHVHRLRRSFADADREPIETLPNGYRLAVDPSSTDAATFERAAAEGHAALAAGDHATAATTLAAALDLWRGAAFAEFLDARRAQAAGVRLEELRLAAQEDLAEAQLDGGGASTAVSVLQRLVREAPGRERAWGLLMRALYASGRQHEALDTAQRARHVLAEEFGLEIGPELRGIEQQIVTQDPALSAGSGATMLAAALRSSTPMAARQVERQLLRAAWAAASTGSGQVRVLRGPVDAGRTRLAADLAGRVVGTGGAVEYLRGADGLGTASSGDAARVVDGFAERARQQPLLIVIDDLEWMPSPQLATVVALVAAMDDLPIMVLLILDPAGGGPAVGAVERIDPTGAATIPVGALDDDDIADIVHADGVEPDAISSVVAVAGGLPGRARREAAAWSENTAGDRLRRAASTSLEAVGLAERAQSSMLQEVLDLVAARARRDRLHSAKWAGRQPYRSLAAYQVQDAELYVGRERLVAELAARLLDRRLVIVVGPSGCGKSSLVRAGLVPLARSGKLPGSGAWRTNVVVPGTNPFAAIDGLEGIDEPSSQLLVIDQFEELFADPADVVEAFATRLVDLSEDPALDTRVVVVVRSDAYPSLALVSGLAAVLQDAQFVVGPPTTDEVRRIVEEPAQRTAMTVEPGLIDLVCADLDGCETPLPLLSAAMAELWEHRDGTALRVEQYLQTGGVASSVERLGEHVVASLDLDDRELLRRCLVSLADLSEEDVWVRRRIPADDVPAEQRAVLDRLVEQRLVVRGPQTVEIVHESVFAAWPQLAAWLDDARDAKRLDRELRAAARVWDSGGRLDDEVLRGARLAAAVEWSARPDVEVTPLVAELLDASNAHRLVDEQSTARRIAAQARSNRRLRRLLVAVGLLLVVALVAGGVALVQRRRADRERDQARVDRLVAESERVLDSQLDLGYLLSVEARRRADTPATRGAILTTLVHTMPTAPAAATAVRFAGYLHREHIDPAPTAGTPFDDFADLSDDGAVLAVQTTLPGVSQTVVYDVATQRVLAHIEAAETDIGSLDLSPEGHSVAVLDEDEDETLRVLDVSTGGVARTRVRAAVAGDFIWPAARFTGDGRALFVLSRDGSLSMWARATLERLPVALPTGPFVHADVLPDGTLFAVGQDGHVVFLDPAGNIEAPGLKLDMADADLGPDALWAVASDRSTVVAGEWQGPLHIWDGETGAQVGTPDTRPDSVRSVTFDPGNPGVVAVGTTTGDIALWDVAADRRVGDVAKVHGSGLRDIVFSADGRTMAATADDNLVSLWGDAGGTPRIDELASAPGDVFHSPDGRLLVFGDETDEIRRTTAPDQAGVVLQSPGDRPFRGRFDAAGTRVALTDNNGLVYVDDTSTGAVLWQHPGVGWQYDLSPDGTMVALGADPTLVLELWDVDADRQLASVSLADLGLPGVGISAEVSFTPDGKFLDVPTGAGPLRVTVQDLRLVTHVPANRSQCDAPRLSATDIVAMDGPGRLSRFDMAAGIVTATGRSRQMTSYTCLAASPDGSLVAGQQWFSHLMPLFDAATMQPIGAPLPIAGDWFIPRFDDDAHVRGLGIDGEWTSWNLDPDAWQAIACHAAGRNLTRAEWAQYIGRDEAYRASCAEWPPAGG